MSSSHVAGAFMQGRKLARQSPLRPHNPTNWLRAWLMPGSCSIQLSPHLVYESLDHRCELALPVWRFGLRAVVRGGCKACSPMEMVSQLIFSTPLPKQNGSVSATRQGMNGMKNFEVYKWCWVRTVVALLSSDCLNLPSTTIIALSNHFSKHL